MSNAKKLQIYTDGSSRNNGSEYACCGWAYKIINEENETVGSGCDIGKTNNQMEMIAIIEALKSIKDKSVSVDLFCDSRYIVNTLNGEYSIRANQDLWRILKNETKRFKSINFIWVKSHDKNKYNNEVDRLATEASGSLCTN